MIYTVTINSAVDRLVRVKGELTRKHNNETYSTEYDIGGKATHVSVALAYLGIPSVATGFAGGSTGEKMVELMEEKGVQCNFIFQDKAMTRESIILIDESHQGSFMVTQDGFSIEDSSLDKLESFLRTNLTEEDICVFAGSPPSNFTVEKYLRLLSIVKEKNAKLIVDAKRDFLKAALTLKPYLVKPNEFEFSEFVQKDLTEIEDFKEEILKLQNLSDFWVVSLGKRGSITVDPKGECYLTIAPKIKEVNETGAGDFFVGGLVSQIYLGSSTEEMLRTASALGASKAMQTTSSSINMDDIPRLKEQVKIERI